MQNVEYQHSVVDPLDSGNTWTFKIIENSITQEFWFTEIQNRQGFLLATDLIPDFVFEAIILAFDQHKTEALARFEKYELILSGTYEVVDPNIDQHVAPKVGEIESGKKYLIVIVTAGAASTFDLGIAFNKQKLLMIPDLPLAEYLDPNFVDDSMQEFSFVFGTAFSEDDDFDNGRVQSLLNDIYVFVDNRGNVYSAFQGSGLQGGHYAIFRINEGV